MHVTELMAQAEASIHGAFSSPTEIFATVSGLMAGALIVVSSFVNTMIPLRCLAVGEQPGLPRLWRAASLAACMMLLHGALLPINICRAARDGPADAARARRGEVERPVGRLAAALHAQQAVKAGAVLFRKGDAGRPPVLPRRGPHRVRRDRHSHGAGPPLRRDRLLRAGQAPHPDRALRRPLHRCCHRRATFEQLYFQNPAFGFRLVDLVAGRLLADVQRLEQRSRVPPRPDRRRRPGGRGERIRTFDPLLPKQLRYQAALHPERCGL